MLDFSIRHEALCAAAGQNYSLLAGEFNTKQKNYNKKL
jgi:hypothetical protein